jgi:mRNA-degrading endonuclease toxin of MazEF toxin-antitoxin module
MTLHRGDIVMTRFPHAGGNRGKKRPAVIIQADAYNAKLKHVIVAEITKNLAAASDPASFLIDVSTPDGKATGLDQIRSFVVSSSRPWARHALLK